MCRFFYFAKIWPLFFTSPNDFILGPKVISQVSFECGTYIGLSLWNLDYKAVLIIAQVFGYMLSKFMGIKVISELKVSGRKKFINGLILFAELALLFFWNGALSL